MLLTVNLWLTIQNPNSTGHVSIILFAAFHTFSNLGNRYHPISGLWKSDLSKLGRCDWRYFKRCVYDCRHFAENFLEIEERMVHFIARRFAVVVFPSSFFRRTVFRRDVLPRNHFATFLYYKVIAFMISISW